MAGLAELGAVMMDVSQRRIETTAGNVGNLSTPGFRARRVFQTLLDGASGLPATQVAMPRPTAPPTLKLTGNALDIAVAPPASLLLRAGTALYPAGSAQLRRDAEGRLVDGMGRILQAAGGGDLVLAEGTPSILRDGTVLVDGRPEARIGLFALDRGTGLANDLGPGLPLDAMPAAADEAVLRQGAVIPSDVDLAAEMVELGKARRDAEAGARIFQIYDELLGKAASSFGETGR
jgi:flagellar basal-body rod protein FlgG